GPAHRIRIGSDRGRHRPSAAAPRRQRPARVARRPPGAAWKGRGSDLADRSVAGDGGGGLMATVELEIAGRKYVIACRDGEEEHLRTVGGIVHRKAREAEGALGSLGEARQLLFASLLLADEVKELRAGNFPDQEPDPQL